MAAADYYNPGGPSGGQQPPRPAHLSPAPNHAQYHGNAPNANPPYPMFDDAPPPYSLSAFPEPHRPHSQPPPQHRPPTIHDQYHPPHTGNGHPMNGHPPTHAYPPEKVPRPAPGTHPMFKASDFSGPYTPQPNQQPHHPPPQQQQQHPQGYFPLAGTAAMAQVYGNGNHAGRRPSTTPGYRPPQSPFHDDYKRDESLTRSRSRSRSRHRKRHHSSRPQPQKKSSGVSTFLGAGGGAIIGDAIFPGLGTLGGALLGGVGGHEYGKHRASSNPSRARVRSYSNDFDYGEYNRDEHRRGRKY